MLVTVEEQLHELVEGLDGAEDERALSVLSALAGPIPGL